MCIAILNKKGNTLPEAYIENSFINNSQGAGLLWAENGKLNEFKTFKYEELRDKYFELRKNLFVGNIVLHFRISTAGKLDKENTHPFFVSKSLAFVHNGVISGLGDKNFSDTWWFNQSILKNLPKSFLKNSATIELIRKYIGNSKLLFLDKNDEYFIVNDKAGTFDENGNWFSNNSHLQINSYVYYGNQRVPTTTAHQAKMVQSRCLCGVSGQIVKFGGESMCFSCGKIETEALITA